MKIISSYNNIIKVYKKINICSDFSNSLIKFEPFYQFQYIGRLMECILKPKPLLLVAYINFVIIILLFYGIIIQQHIE